MVNNLKEVFFSTTVPSLVNFREWVTEEDDPFAESVTRKFGGDMMKANGKIDLELGIIGKDGKPHVDYGGTDQTLKKEKGGKITTVDTYLFPDNQEKRYASEERMLEEDDDEDDDGTELSSQRTSSAALRR